MRPSSAHAPGLDPATNRQLARILRGWRRYKIGEGQGKPQRAQ